MDIAITPAIERIARVLAAQRLSVNATGDQPSAALDVDDTWPDYRAERSECKTLREPETPMTEAGHSAIGEWIVLPATAQEDPFEPRADADETV